MVAVETAKVVKKCSETLAFINRGTDNKTTKRMGMYRVDGSERYPRGVKS